MTGDPPADPAVDPRPARGRAGSGGAVLVAISAGGVLGACARHALALALPHRPGQFPWATLLTNVSGCLLIGALMALITEVRPAHRLVRPFLGVGVLGGYTTFSTYVLDIQQLAAAGRVTAGLLYLVGTLAAALAAVQFGAAAVRLAARATLRPAEGAR